MVTVTGTPLHAALNLHATLLDAFAEDADDELGHLPFEKRSAHLFFQLVARREEKGSILLPTNQLVTQWGGVFGDDVLAAEAEAHIKPPRKEPGLGPGPIRAAALTAERSRAGRALAHRAA